MVGAGSTTREFAGRLARIADLAVVTNSLLVAQVLFYPTTGVPATVVAVLVRLLGVGRGEMVVRESFGGVLALRDVSFSLQPGEMPSLRDVSDLDRAWSGLPDEVLRARVRQVVIENARVLETVALLESGADVRRIGPLPTPRRRCRQRDRARRHRGRRGRDGRGARGLRPGGAPAPEHAEYQ